MSSAIDPRIQAILAKYEDPSEQEQTVEEITPPPKTLEEWLEKNSLRDWPERLASEGELDITNDTIGLGSVEDIIADLRAHAPLDIHLFDQVDAKLDALSGKLDVYASKILNRVEKSVTSGESRLFHTPSKALSISFDDEIINKKHKVKTQVPLLEKHTAKARTVENANYPGFMPKELVHLPGVEAPQLLNRITKAQNFSAGFRRMWKKYFLSAASVAVMEDLFWWFFLQKFQPSKTDQNHLFSRISDSFVALLFHLPTDYRDKFMMHYPVCLAQALYAAFCEVFPHSYKSFSDDFKTDLVNTVYEWITGTQPPPKFWINWNFEKIEPDNIREIQDDKAQLNVDMSFDLERSLREAEKSKDKKASVWLERTSSRMAKHGPEIKKESHQIGPGPSFERVNFNIVGKSPLVSHFLHMRNLKSNVHTDVRNVNRTEISELPPAAQTYQQIIAECDKNLKTLNAQYQRVLEISAQESGKIQKQKRDALRQISKLQHDLSHKTIDAKILSERIMEIMEQPDITMPSVTSSSLGRYASESSSGHGSADESEGRS